MINSSSLSSGVLNAALFHGIQWQTSIAIYSACYVPIIIDPPFYITHTEIPLLALYLGVSTKFTGTDFQSSLSISLYWISTFIPVAALVAVVPVSMHTEMHTVIQELVYLMPWIYLTLTMIHLAPNSGEFRDQLWNHVFLKKDYAPRTC